MLDRMYRMKQDSESTPHPVNPVKVRAVFPYRFGIGIRNGSGSSLICVNLRNLWFNSPWYRAPHLSISYVISYLDSIPNVLYAS